MVGVHRVGSTWLWPSKRFAGRRNPQNYVGAFKGTPSPPMAHLKRDALSNLPSFNLSFLPENGPRRTSFPPLLSKPAFQTLQTRTPMPSLLSHRNRSDRTSYPTPTLKAYLPDVANPLTNSFPPLSPKMSREHHTLLTKPTCCEPLCRPKPSLLSHRERPKDIVPPPFPPTHKACLPDVANPFNQCPLSSLTRDGSEYTVVAAPSSGLRCKRGRENTAIARPPTVVENRDLSLHSERAPRHLFVVGREKFRDGGRGVRTQFLNTPRYCRWVQQVRSE